jgi:phosphoglucosamine mutase
VLARGADLGVAFDGDGDRIVAVDEHGATVDGDGILAILALHLGVGRVCVTQMSNAGFGELMVRHSIALTTTPVGDRYVLEALRREGALLGGEQAGHVIYLDGHVAGDGLTAALLLCGALEGRRLSDAHAVLVRYPQATANVAVSSTTLTPALNTAVSELSAALEGAGRVLVRPSGTEPLVRVLVEAREEQEAQRACASIAALVESELG